MSSAYIAGLLLKNLAKSEYKWFHSKQKNKFGSLKYLIAALGGLAIGPAPNNSSIIIIYGILIAYSSLNFEFNRRIALISMLKQMGIFLLFGAIGLVLMSN
jgi:hypothetical protein